MTEKNAENNALLEKHRIKSYVIRAGRMTTAQSHALTELSPKYLIDVSDEKPLDMETVFGREAPLVVEIGSSSSWGGSRHDAD